MAIVRISPPVDRSAAANIIISPSRRRNPAARQQLLSVQIPRNSKNACNALALVIIRSRPGSPGTVTLAAESGGLAGAEVDLRTE